MTSGFKYRILVADSGELSLDSAASLLSREGYVVLTARDGFEALVELRRGVPEIIVAELNMPRMSGFELLAVVRQRFPQIGVVAISDEFCPAGEMPPGVLADRFVRKAANSDFELLETVRELIAELPIRPSYAKPSIAPAWIPRTATGYVVITCTSCLRSSSVRLRDLSFGVLVKDSCLHCGAEIVYRLDTTTISVPDRQTFAQKTFANRSQQRADESRRAVTESHKAIAESKKRIAKPRG